MSSNALDLKTLESAAAWYVDLRAGLDDEALRAAHQHWLENDPRHRRAWDRVLRLQGKFEGLASPSIARATIQGANIRRRDTLKILAVLLAAGTAAPLAWRSVNSTGWMADHRTQIGEQRHVRLEDGTRLHLNTATAVNIYFGETLREVVLLQGEILIETAQDTLYRPFVVHTDEGSMRALGTRFVVFRDDNTTHLSVIKHAVEVRPAELVQRSVTLSAGQQVSFSAGILGRVIPADPQVDAWTRNMLIVSNWRLGDFVRQVQRYRPGYLGCDPRVAELRLSGAFNLGSTEAILENLRKTLPVQVRQFTRYWVRIEAAAAV